MNRIFILISLFSSTVLSADEVETVDGSILKGEILTIEDNNLTILTEFAGKLKIPDFRISRISCENELSFRMEDNRTFQGKINFSDGSVHDSASPVSNRAEIRRNLINRYRSRKIR